jgi:hypothetical protein
MATAVAAAVVASVGATGVAATVITGVVTLAATVALNFVARALAPKPETPDLSSFASIRTRGATQQFRQPVTERRIVYGEQRVSGPIVLASVTDNNRYLHLAIVLASHEVESIDEIFINDVSIPNDALDGDGTVNTGRYDGLVRIQKQLGTTAQTANSDLVSAVSGWTTNHRLREMAYIYVRLDWDRDVFPAGIPNFSAWVRGRKCFDNRDSTTKYTSNIALMANNYLTDDRFGLEATQASVDGDFYDAAANTCDEMVTTANLDIDFTSYDEATDIITLDGDRLQYQTGDRVSITSGSIGGASTSTTNLLLQSENIVDGADWADIRGTLTSNQIKSPISDEITADLFTEDSATGGHYIYQDVSINQQIDHTCSIYVKANGRNDFRLRLNDKVGSGDINVEFDLSAETSTAGSVNGVSTLTDHGIENIGDDWYRIYVTGIVNSSGGTNDIRFYLYSKDGSTRDYTGDGTSGFYVFGAQLEPDAALNEYVKTTTSSASAGTNYYVIAYQRKDTPRIKLANSLSNAIAGTAINLTGSTSSGTFRKNAEPRYHGGGIVKTSAERGENLKEILAGMAGQAIYAGGTWKFLAGEYQTPTISLDESDLAGGLETVTKVSERERFNRVQGIYVSPLNDNNPSDYPLVSNSTYATEDGKVIKRNLDLSFTTRPHTAQRIAKIALERMRQEIICSARFKLSAFQVQAGDNFQFSFEKNGWTNKVFEVLTWELNSEDGAVYIDMKFRENASAVYDWNNGEETAVDPAPNTELSNPFEVDPPTGLSVTPIEIRTAQGDFVYEFRIDFTPPNDPFVTSGGYYETQYKLSNDSTYENFVRAEDDQTQIRIKQVNPVSPYDFRMRAVNYLGVRSQYQSLLGFTVDSPSGATVTFDYGLNTGTVTETRDYGNVVDSVETISDYGDII